MCINIYSIISQNKETTEALASLNTCTMFWFIKKNDPMWGKIV